MADNPQPVELPNAQPGSDPSVSGDSSGHNAAGTTNGGLAISPQRSVSSRGRKRTIKVFDSGIANNSDINPKKSKGVKEKDDVESEFDKQWICAECKEAECSLNPEAEQLLVCEGLCRRLFHYPCVNMKSLPAEDEPYFCVDCSTSRHRCSICQDYGDDGIEVFKCRRDDCGFFFHEGCLAVRNIDFTYKDVGKLDCGGRAEDLARLDDEIAFGIPVFECPAHRCWACAQTNADPTDIEAKAIKSNKKKSLSSGALESKRGELFRCIECPCSYHLTCIPPTARLHELAILCHEHAPTCKLPDFDRESSIQLAIENEVDKKFFDGSRKKVILPKTQISRNSFFLGFLGDHRTKLESLFAERALKLCDESPESWYCLPASIRDDVYSRPPNYKHIQVNKVNAGHAPPRLPLGEPCQCKEKCAEDCLNRFTYMECTSKNCKVGPACGNRRIAQRKVPKCKVKREQGKGWGLVTLEPIRLGDLVQEYIGEIIDEKEKEKRLTEWSRDHPNDPNFYVMAVAPGWFIDARHTSNLSRFINHSCKPNCILSTFNVNGVMRNGIYALRDIAAGEYLSYDYNFDTLHNDKFTCRCGAPTCRGTLRYTGQRKDDNMNKTQKQLWDEAKASYERDKKFVEDYNRDEAMRRSQVAATVPGCSTNDELVANGPQQHRYRQDVLEKRLFLWRNAELGSNFVTRSISLASGRLDTEDDPSPLPLEVNDI